MARRKLAIGIVLALGALAVFLIVGRKPNSPAQTSSDKDVATAGAVTSDRFRSRPTFPATAVDRAKVPGTPSVAEMQVIGMYDEMTTGLKQNFNNCSAMARVIEASLNKHAPSLATMLKDRAGMTPEEIGMAQRRLEQQQGPKLQQLRDRMKQAIAKCKHSPELMGALRGLAGLKAPGQATASVGHR